MLRNSLIGLALLILVATPALAVERVVLDNGLVVLLESQRSAPALSVSAFIRAGRIYEPEEKGGISHFTEHMMFRATGRRPQGNAEREVWKTGGRMTAYTREDYTEYGVLLPSSRATLALEVVSDYLTAASFLPGEIEEERKVVLDEIRMRAANVQTSAFESLQALTYLPHPYGARIAGSARTVSSITRQDLLGYYESHYRPDRSALVVVGDFEQEEMLQEIRRWFGAWKRLKAALPEPRPLDRSFGHYQEAVEFREGASPLLLASFPLPGYLHQDYLPSLFLRPILSGWIAQRLVVRERVALAADSYHTTLAARNSLTVRLTLAHPEDAADARDALLTLFADFTRPGFSWESVPRVASNLRAREVLVAEDFQRYASLIGKAAMYGYYEAAGRPAHLAADDRYRAVESSDVARVARTYLQPQNARVLFLLPPGTEVPDPPEFNTLPDAGHPAAVPLALIPYEATDAHKAGRTGSPRQDTDTTRTELDTGPVLLYLERTGAPVVAGSIAFRAGSKHDPVGKEGLAKLTMEALSISTRDEAGDSPRWRLFALGHDVDFNVDRDVANVTFAVPADGLREALLTIVRMLTEPTFSEEAIEEARGRLLRAERQESERVGQFAGNRFRTTVYAGTRLAHERYGTPQSLGAITAEDVRSFHRSYLRLPHSVIAVVGAVAPRRARALVQEALAREAEAGLDPVPASQRRLDWPSPPVQLDLRHPSGRSYVILGGRAPALGEKLSPETTLLRLALGWRVFQEFTDVRSTAYEAGTFYDSYSPGGDFGLYVGTTAQYAEETLRALREILSTAVRDGLPETLVADARTAWLGGADLHRMRSVNIARRLAHREMEGLGYGSFESLQQRISRLTSDDLKGACGAIFPDGRCTSILVNVPPAR